MTEDEIRQALQERGFLAPVVLQDFPAQYRQMASGWFEMAESFSRVGQRIAVRAIGQGHGAADPRAYGTVLLLRTLQSYQAAFLLCSMGLATEARMLIRSCFENAFCIAALVKDPAKLVKALEDDDKAAKKAQAKFLVADPTRMVCLDAKAKARLQKFASTVDQQWGKVRQLAIDETAKSTPLREAYLFYRLLSNDSCHPSATSLSRHIIVLPDGHWDYQLGPEPANKLADSLNIACHAIMSALVAFTELVNDADGNREVAAAVAAYSRVNDAVVAGQRDPSP
jgi:hypothetical protein